MHAIRAFFSRCIKPQTDAASRELTPPSSNQLAHYQHRMVSACAGTCSLSCSAEAYSTEHSRQVVVIPETEADSIFIEYHKFLDDPLATLPPR